MDKTADDAAAVDDTEPDAKRSPKESPPVRPTRQAALKTIAALQDMSLVCDSLAKLSRLS